MWQCLLLISETDDASKNSPTPWDARLNRRAPIDIFTALKKMVHKFVTLEMA